MSKAYPDLHHIIVSTPSDSSNLLLWDSPISSIFSPLSTSSADMQTQLDCPDILNNSDVSDVRVCSCDGILCFTIMDQYPLLWNPSIRRFSMFPHFKHPGRGKRVLQSTFSFGYVHSTHNYMIVDVSLFEVNTYGVSVYTLGTDYWRRIQDFSYSGPSPMPGVFVSGTINWLILEEEEQQSNCTPDITWAASYPSLHRLNHVD